MQVTLIGTGSICCKQISASTLIDGRVLVDLPNGGVKEILKQGYELEKIEMILLTHLHADHYWDMPFLWGHLMFLERKTPLYIVGPIGTKKKMCKILEESFEESPDTYIQALDIRFEEIKETQKTISIMPEYEVEVVPVEHGGIESAYGYVINKALGLTGDANLCRGVETIVKKAKTTILDVSCIKGDIFHMGLDNIQYLSKTYGKPMIATHMRKKTREEGLKHPIENLLICEDGYQFEL